MKIFPRSLKTKNMLVVVACFQMINPRRGLIIVRRELTCETSIEVPYYSAKTVKLQLICFHCGGNAGAALANDSDILELRKLHTVVRPICTFCKNTGKNPAPWGTKFVKKK